MEKRKRPLIDIGAVCLCLSLCLLAGCNTLTHSSPATPSSIALTQTSISETQGTPDIIFQLIGTYTGTVEWHGVGSSTRMHLEITKQNANELSGVCLLGTQHAPLVNALVGTAFGGEEGDIMFTVDTPASQAQQPISLDFTGTVTKQGSMTGDVKASDGRTGTWSAQKVP